MHTRRTTTVMNVALTLLLFTLTISSFKPLQDKDNNLTPDEKKAGWKLLFDGKTIKGWRTYQNKPADSWEILQGELVNKSKGVTKRADLITAEQYDNFEFSVDWKIAAGSNSGIIYRSTEDHGATFESGPEYQLIDDNGYPDKLEDWQKSGADYAMHPPLKLVVKPVGEYNHTRIVVNNAHVEHWLNGEKVADFDFWTPEWQKLKEAGKWKDAPGYGMSKKGHIALQDHGGGVWFKNIKIRKL